MVEQECAYQELDGRDLEPGTRHLWAELDGEPVGYLRILDDGDHVRHRPGARRPAAPRRGLSGVLMRAALEVVGDRASVLDAQTPLAGWYAGFGFVQDGSRSSRTASRTPRCAERLSRPARRR